MNKLLKVFAEYKEECDLQYRTKTILQYGNSWSLIGTIVMKNPGSAYPVKEIGREDFDKLQKHFYPLSRIEDWFEFKEDSTIRKIASLYDGTFVNNKKDLNGIILIYNLFNIREKGIVEAVRMANASTSENLFPDLNEIIKLSENKPIYLGFNWEYTNKTNLHHERIKKFANDLFDHVKSSENMYLEDDILNNYYYHPLAPKISNPKYRHILERFYEKLLISKTAENL